MEMTISPNKIKGSMLGGAIGDALGFTVEFMSEDYIFSHYGENGITEYSLCDGVALISDDTQMSMFTADGLLNGQNYCQNPTVDQYVQSVYESYLNWLSTQEDDFVLPEFVRKSDLLKYKELHSRRAPGHTCLSALRSGICGTFENKLNWSKGCGEVMRVAPVALYLSERNASKAMIGETAARVAAITHSHELGYIPAAFFALLLDGFLKSGYTENSISNALIETQNLFPESEQLNIFSELVKKAETLAYDEEIFDDLDAIRELGEGWVAEETVAIAVYCTLKHKDSFEQAIIASVNHDGDSDSTGALTGNLIGALVGYKNIPRKYLDNLELKNALIDLSEKMAISFHIEEYREAYAEEVKDLLVELQTYLAGLDKRGVLVLKDNYRDGYFNYVLGEVKKHYGKIFIAKKSNRVIGVITCKIFQGGGEEEYATSCPKIGFISDLVVAKSEREQGVGKALLKCAEKYFVENKCDFTQLEVFAPNTQAFDLYKKLGYEVNCFYLSKKQSL